MGQHKEHQGAAHDYEVASTKWFDSLFERGVCTESLSPLGVKAAGAWSRGTSFNTRKPALTMSSLLSAAASMLRRGCAKSNCQVPLPASSFVEVCQMCSVLSSDFRCTCFLRATHLIHTQHLRTHGTTHARSQRSTQTHNVYVWRLQRMWHKPKEHMHFEMRFTP